jgi:hypothetical protein
MRNIAHERRDATNLIKDCTQQSVIHEATTAIVLDQLTRRLPFQGRVFVKGGIARRHSRSAWTLGLHGGVFLEQFLTSGQPLLQVLVWSSPLARGRRSAWSTLNASLYILLVSKGPDNRTRKRSPYFGAIRAREGSVALDFPMLTEHTRKNARIFGGD